MYILTTNDYIEAPFVIGVALNTAGVFKVLLNWLEWQGQMTERLQQEIWRACEQPVYEVSGHGGNDDMPCVVLDGGMRVYVQRMHL